MEGTIGTSIVVQLKTQEDSAESAGKKSVLACPKTSQCEYLQLSFATPSLVLVQQFSASLVLVCSMYLLSLRLPSIVCNLQLSLAR